MVNDTLLMELVEADIAKNPQVAESPIGSLDDFNHSFGRYLEHVLTQMRQDIRTRMQELIGYPPSAAEVDQAIAETPDLRDAVVALSIQYVLTLNFIAFHRKTFYLDDAIVERLSVTDMNAPAEYLRLPFKCCLFASRSPLLFKPLYQLSQRPQRHSTGTVSIFATERPEHDMRKIVFTIYHSDGNATHTLIKRELLIHPDWTIEQALRTDWNKVYEQNPDWKSNDSTIGDIIGHNDHEEAFYQAGLPLFRIIINALLYLGSNAPDILEQVSPRQALLDNAKETNSIAKRKKIRTKAKQYSSLDGAVVGSRFARILIDKSTLPTNPTANGQHSHAGHRFLVRGHWRNQPHGPNRTERKLIFIEPFYKGDDMAELINKPYVVI